MVECGLRRVVEYGVRCEVWCGGVWFEACSGVRCALWGVVWYEGLGGFCGVWYMVSVVESGLRSVVELGMWSVVKYGMSWEM